jgi:hypothetical protein
MAGAEPAGFSRSLPEKLVFPLAIAAATAAFAWFFGPHLTNSWQDRQQHFATKTALVDELSIASARLMSAVQTREFQPKTENDGLYLKAFRTWDTESQEIDARIATYFVGGEKIAGEWRGFVDAMRLYHNLPGQPKANGPRKDTVAHLLEYVQGQMPPAQMPAVRQALMHPPDSGHKAADVVYQDAWVKLKYALIARLAHQRTAG